MGSGKTTLSKKLAKKFDMEYISLDDEIEKEFGMTIPEIFKEKGEKAFREKETEILRKIVKLKGEEDVILDLGGGTYTKPENIEILKGTNTYFLHTPLEKIYQRLENNRSNRPLLNCENWKEKAKNLYDERIDSYKKATASLSLTDNSYEPLKVAEIIVNKTKNEKLKNSKLLSIKSLELLEGLPKQPKSKILRNDTENLRSEEFLEHLDDKGENLATVNDCIIEEICEKEECDYDTKIEKKLTIEPPKLTLSADKTLISSQVEEISCEDEIIIPKLEKPIDATLDLPGSKSLSIRALLLSAFADGVSSIDNVLDSDDVNNCISALKKLGIKIVKNGNKIIITGCNGKLPINEKSEIFVGSSGIASRFLTSLIVASKRDFPIKLNGTEQLKNRSIKPLVDVLNQNGADIKYLEKDGFLPILINPSRLKTDYIEISGKDSSQYVSSVLMMAPLLGNKIKVKPLNIAAEDHPYIKMALETMKDFGISYKDKNGIYEFLPQNYKSRKFTVETDLNTAGYFFALACMTKSTITIKNINRYTSQPGIIFLDLLRKMGAKVKYNKDSKSVTITGESIKGGFDIDMFKMSESVMTLAVMSVFADKPIKIHGVEHIRHHECDRISSIVKELQKLGIECKEYKDGLKIIPTTPEFAEVDSHEDHRIVMAMSILGLAGKGIKIKNPTSVSKTCPTFFQLLEKIEKGANMLDKSYKEPSYFKKAIKKVNIIFRESLESNRMIKEIITCSIETYSHISTLYSSSTFGNHRKEG